MPLYKNIGEVLTGSLASGSATSLTTNTPKTICSMSLTAGDWDVFGTLVLLPANTTVLTRITACASQTTDTLDAALGAGNVIFCSMTGNGTNTQTAQVAGYRIQLAATTTIYLVGQANFTVSTCTGYGIISARRWA